MAADGSYRIRGEAREAAPLPTQRVGIANSRRLAPGERRDAAAGAVEVAAGELVRVTLANGFTLWTRADDLVRERGTRTQARGGEPVWAISLGPPSPRGASPSLGVAQGGPPSGVRGGTRGWLGLGVETLEFFGVDLKAWTARQLAGYLEDRQLGREPGLYACALDEAFSLTPAAEVPAGKGPCLVLIHGTGSSCKGAFGDLWAPQSQAGKAARQALGTRYGDRVFAWEHRTLTQSPIANALELAGCLPKGAELDLVAHSRGGLVAELLCLAERDRNPDPLRPDLVKTLFAADRTVAEQLGLSPLDAAALKARDRDYEADHGALTELLTLLDERQLRVHRFVRAACPARGTTLASGRLDRWLSVLTYLGGIELVGDALDFVLAVVKERTDPRTLPGLEAMMPGSALTRLLNHPDLVTRADLSAIAGDVEGESLWGQLKLLAADWFYGADHDLMVNTGSMLGGPRRPPGGARFQRDQGPEVNHFRYFKNDRSLRWLTAGLARVEGADGGFHPIEAAPHEAPRWREAVRRNRGAGRPQPLAVVLPGIMGSSLRADGRDVWLDYGALLRGGLERLRLDQQGTRVEPGDLLDAFYGPLLEFLARSHRVEAFPYDWRRSVREAARDLARRLEDWLPEAERARQPVHLVAHSMGGLVVRAMIADGGPGAAVWRRIVALPESRLLMLGTPNQGSYEALRWLTGTNPTLVKLSLLDVAHSRDAIIDIVRDYPGLLELLPWGADDPDLGRVQFWKDLRRALGAAWSTAGAAALRQARDTWTLLRPGLPDTRRIVYVAGCQGATIAGYALTPYEESHLAGRNRLDFLATAQGDGTVTWRSGTLPGVPVWYVDDTAHDALCTRSAAFAGYLDLLLTGKTARLPQTPPGRTRDATTAQPGHFPLPAVPPLDDIPDEAATARFGFGPGGPPEAAEQGAAAPAIRVSVRQGNLAYARYPVLVGHYLEDTIVNAERALDQHLSGALSRRAQLGLYPGQLGTQALFLNDQPLGKPAGALVIGLGQVGELSPGAIETGVRDALLDYALRIDECPDGRFGDPKGVRSAALTCLLVGSGAGGVTVSDSVDAILRGAVAAAGRLAETGLEARVVIDGIELLELYQDIAIAAAEALEQRLTDPILADRVVWQVRVIEEGEGGLHRLRGDGPSDWWQRMEIVDEAHNQVLRFIASTDRARAEVTLATGQLRLADAFIAQASLSERTNTEVSKTLFEMLLPVRLRELSHRQDDLVVLVDEVSARFPWELLEDRWSHSGRPPSVAAGLVRQLKAQTFRAQPAHATAAKALVVGNPDLGGWQDFADLSGARDEASRVAQLLRDHGFQVLDVIDAGPDAILNGLHKDAWRILHLAGHGVHEFPVAAPAAGCPACGQVAVTREERLSGMAIGRDTLLTPGDVEQMRWVPELVFVNCCHLGKTLLRHPPHYNWLAANLAVQFIRMGVRAVVAAGWAVDDQAGLAFAEGFYARLIEGDQFGDAVRAAREEVWTRFPNVNTWGAYQCYGDPSYRLRRDRVAALRPAGRRYHAPSELVSDLRKHTESIRMQIRDRGEDLETLTGLRQGINDLFAAIPEAQRATWLVRADVAAAVGFAWGETRDYAEAVTWLDRALGANLGDCPVRAVEQRNAFRVRLIGDRWLALNAEPEGPGKEDRRQALVEQVDDSIAELALVCQRAPTVERLTLLGNACRRLAWLQTHRPGRLEALVNMASYYGQAIQRADGRGMEHQLFPHWVVAKVLGMHMDAQAWRDAGAGSGEAGVDRTRAGDWQAGLADDCRRMIELAAARNVEQPSFRNAAAEADNETALLLTLTEGQDVPPGAAGRIVDLYRAAFRRGASPREVAAVHDGLDFLLTLGDVLPAAVSAALANIRQAL